MAFKLRGGKNPMQKNFASSFKQDDEYKPSVSTKRALRTGEDKYGQTGEEYTTDATGNLLSMLGTYGTGGGISGVQEDIDDWGEIGRGAAERSYYEHQVGDKGKEMWGQGQTYGEDLEERDIATMTGWDEVKGGAENVWGDEGGKVHQQQMDDHMGAYNELVERVRSGDPAAQGELDEFLSKGTDFYAASGRLAEQKRQGDLGAQRSTQDAFEREVMRRTNLAQGLANQKAKEAEAEQAKIDAMSNRQRKKYLKEQEAEKAYEANLEKAQDEIMGVPDFEKTPMEKSGFKMGGSYHYGKKKKV